MILPLHVALLLARERMADDHRRADQLRRVSAARQAHKAQRAGRARPYLRILRRRRASARPEAATHLP